MNQIITEILKWLPGNYGWTLSLLIQGFIAYHVYWLTQRLTSKARLEHKEEIKRKTETLLSEIQNKGLNSEVYLVNSKRYFKDYPSNKEKRFEGYSHIKAEIKAIRFNGIEFFSGMPVAVYRNEQGKLSLKEQESEKAFNAYPVSIVPYEWIEHLDLEGDEYAFVPLFYCLFKGKTDWKFWRRLLFFGYPYKRTVYYKKSDVYDEKNDPKDMKFQLITQEIK